MSYAPLGQGNRNDMFSEPEVTALAEKYHKSEAQVLLRFLTQKGIIVIPRSTEPEHIRENFDIFDFTLTEDELSKLTALDQKTALIGNPNTPVIFIRGAIEGQNLELDLDETVFDDEVWREIYQQKERLFSGLDVIGWALLRMGFSVRLNDKIKKTHFENFPGEGKVLYMMDDLEGEDAFYVFRGEDLSRQNGYYNL